MGQFECGGRRETDEPTHEAAEPTPRERRPGRVYREVVVVNPKPDVDGRVLVLALARFADAVGNSFLIVVLPLFIASGAVSGDAFGLSPAFVTGLVLSLYGFLNSFGQPFTGRFSDRAGTRKLFVLVGLAVLAVANVAYAFAGSYASLLVIRALQGVGVAFTVPATVALINELSTSESRGSNMGLFNTFRLLGVGLGPIAAGLIIDAGPYSLAPLASGVVGGFDAAFYAAGATVFVSYLLVAAYVSDPESTATAAGEDLSIDVLAREDGRTVDPIFTLAVAGLFMAVAIGLIAALEPIINERLDQHTTWFGLQFGAFVLSQVVLQLPVGSASDRWGRRPFLLIGLAILVPATLAQGLVTTSVGMLATRIGQGIAGAMVFAPGLALAGDIADDRDSGTKLSVLTMSFGLGTAIGPLSAGYLVRFGFVVPFAFGAGLATLGFLLVYTQVQETVDRTADEAGPPAGSATGEPAPTD
jgi:MFS family permease